jgi:hypothetical protein
MRAGRVVLAGLLMWTIASAARSYSRTPERSGTPAGAIFDTDATVPAPVRSALRGACFDCHSNETRWPWYSSVPLVSWLIEHDVSEGRAQLNFSTWQEYSTFERADLLDKVCEKATKREMPLWQYRLLHRESRLNTPDVVALCTWSRREAARLVAAGP